jgi:hypothetical protein
MGSRDAEQPVPAMDHIVASRFGISPTSPSTLGLMGSSTFAERIAVQMMSSRSIDSDFSSSLLGVIAQQLRMSAHVPDHSYSAPTSTLPAPMTTLPSRETAQNLIERFFEYCSCFQPILEQDQVAAE